VLSLRLSIMKFSRAVSGVKWLDGGLGNVGFSHHSTTWPGW